MPLTPETRRKVDQIRDYLYGGGYPDPMNNAEKLAFLFSGKSRVRRRYSNACEVVFCTFGESPNLATF